MIRIAAVGDLHFGEDSPGTFSPHLEQLSEVADVLMIAGDLTKAGKAAEAAVLADEVRDVEVPVVCVLGNHDYHSGEQAAIAEVMERAGVTVLEGATASFDLADLRVGVAGTKGFGGGFAGANGTDFGEPEMKGFIRHTKGLADRLEASLRTLDTDVRLVLLHYSPVRETLTGEPPEVYPFLGSYLLSEAVDRVGAHLVVHGHAHRGSEKGITPAGIPVRNVAQSVIGHAYNLYSLSDGSLNSPDDEEVQKNS